MESDSTCVGPSIDPKVIVPSAAAEAEYEVASLDLCMYIGTLTAAGPSKRVCPQTPAQMTTKRVTGAETRYHRSYETSEDISFADPVYAAVGKS